MSNLVRHGVTASRQRQQQVLLFTTLLQNKRWLSSSSSWFSVGGTQVQILTRMDQIMFSKNCISRHNNTSLVISCSNFHTSSHLADNRVRDKFETVSNINKEKRSTTIQIQRVAVTSSDILPSIPSTTPPGSSQNRESPVTHLSDISSSQSQKSTPTAPHTPPRPIKPKKVTKFFLFKFFEFVKKFPEKKFPGAMNVYRVFTIGVKEFAKELADYVRISGKVIMSSNGIRNLNSTELDIYYRMPKEVTRVAPTLIISALPFMNYIMFPIAYYFPKRLLSSHFWSLQQKSQFAIDLHQRKVSASFRQVGLWESPVASRNYGDQALI
ncbi:uncharacterized protein LOC110848636 isoform X2 [Folsomia candida]|uniref:uncharacterized protein LOC110848636 isoform X2 n=1 Tax=Folsomia candida TaxID=158441 RepID=UPI00160556F1|nr:uncharacterized protein LOC110848636 isoform X2 [Folsomia candida]